MPVIDREKEREIVIQGRAQGKDDLFIKSAILRFRERAKEQEKPKVLGGIEAPFVGALKGAGTTLQNIGQVALAAPALIPGGKTFKERLGEVKQETGFRPETLSPQGRLEQTGFNIEQIAEFFVPSTTVVKGAKVIGLAGKGVKKLLGRSTLEAGVFGAQTVAQQGEFNEEAKTAAIIGAMFPVAGAVLSKVAPALKAVGEKVQKVVIRPNARDVKDGFKIENVNKYDLGGSLVQTLEKANNKMNRLTQGLRDTIKSTSDKNVTINLKDTLIKTQEALVKRGGRSFGNINAIQNQLKALEREIKELAGTGGIVDFVEAQSVKRGAGTKGAWVFGSADPNARATEIVYTSFYKQLREAMEGVGSQKMQDINKQLSEIIPINNAVLRRMPVADRNNAISLTDSIGIFAAIFDPRALAFIGIKQLLSAGKFGNILSKAADKLGGKPKSALGQRVLGN